MSVLVNGSPTEDFIVGKGLRQGDPLSPFLFLIVAEGLTGLMSKAVESSLFHGYKVSNNISFHTLQFADDTILVGEGNWSNLWTIKTVMRSFELVSGLKVNFFKSKLYGINLDDNFLGAASSFLHCGVDSIPFRFLGIPVGANPRRKATWCPILESMKKRLCSWNGRNLSIGGRVTLINSVLSSLPLYFFSFYKAPVCVIKEMVSIQRSFLWGGGLDNNKMCWVSWNRICQPKERGGLGIKNLESFNFSLLCKWKWRCLEDRTAPWYEFLRYRYGSFAANFLYDEGKEGLHKASIWWRDIWYLGSEVAGGWFANNVSIKLGKGTEVSFWKEKWIGPTPLRVLYPSLYAESMQPESNISTMGKWTSDNWIWELHWTTELTDTEAITLAELQSLLVQVRPSLDESDRRRWIPHAMGFFSVRTAYTAVQNSSNSVHELDPITVKVLDDLWSNNVPSKISIFGWRLLIEKLPTREALYNKGIITNNHERCCVFCLREVEDINHIFYNCRIAIQIWNRIFGWMGIQAIPFAGIQNHFAQFGTCLKGSHNKKHRHIIWLATTWCIWRKRNNIVFRGESMNISSLVEQIIYIAWFWYIGRGEIVLMYLFPIGVQVP
jgi:hypothetical protein